jgi:citrate synthase
MTSTSLTTNQVAQRLGVKPATVYAYVSRGLLHRELADDGRTSRFDSTEVDELARRGRPRRDARRTGVVDVVLSSVLTEIRDGELRYRGHDAAAMAGASAFEEVAELLWGGELPDQARWSAPAADVALARAVTTALGPEVTPADRIRVATAAVASSRPLRVDLRAEAVTRHGRSLLATLVDALPSVGAGAPAVRKGAGARPARLAARLWPKLSAAAGSPARVRALDAALVLLADHELASSTLAARVAASTRSDPYDVVLAGLGAVSGPLHEGAGTAAYRMLVQARSSRSADRAVGEALTTDGRIPGFGHPLYPDRDPRAACLLDHLSPALSTRDASIVEATRTAATATSGEPPNVDFALAALAFAGGMAADAIEAIFALARIAGWIAHALEEYGERPLRFRTRAIYVGD